MVNRTPTPELGPPEPIRPSGIQRDTFVQPAQAPINRDAENLERALGIFGRGIAKLQAGLAVEDKLKKNAAIQQSTIEFNEWAAGLTNSDRIDAIRTGKVSWADHPLIGPLVRKEYAQWSVNALGEAIDKDIANGSVPLGQNGFDPERYVIERVKPRIQEFSWHYGEAQVFRKGLDTIRDGLAARHKTLIGQANQQAFEDIALRNIRDGYRNAFDAMSADPSITPTDVEKSIAAIKKSLGPVVKGGSLDLQYGRMDDIHLSVLSELAKDPKYAKSAIIALDTDRVRAEDGLTRIGPLSASLKHKEKVEAVRGEALRTLARANEEDQKTGIIARASEAIKAGDGSLAAMPDYRGENPYSDKPVVISSAEIKREAFKRRFAEIEREHASIQNPNERMARITEDKLDAAFREGYSPPEFENVLKGGVAAGTTQVTKDGALGPEQEARIISGAAMYQALQQRNPSATIELVGEKGTLLYESYLALRTSGLDAASAARQASLRFAPGKDGVTPIERDNVAVTRAINGMGTWFPYENAPSNEMALRPKVAKLVTALMASGTMSEKEAIDEASKRVKEQSIVVNGDYLFGVPRLQKGDEVHIKGMLNDFWKANETEMRRLNATGYISNSDLLRVVPRGDKLIILDPNGRPLEISGPTPAISIQSIVERRERVRKMKEQNRAREISTPSPNFWENADIMGNAF